MPFRFGGVETDFRQRSLVNRRLRLADFEIVTKYVFPFWDRRGRVLLTVVDRLGQPPGVLRIPVRPTDRDTLVSAAGRADLVPLGDVDPSSFADLFHYDPWWVFRGMAGVGEAWRRAVLPTNISRPFPFEGRMWKVHDVEFWEDGSAIQRIVAKDDLFRPRSFTATVLDFGVAWPKA